jgi:hypothetical protein
MPLPPAMPTWWRRAPGSRARRSGPAAPSPEGVAGLELALIQREKRPPLTLRTPTRSSPSSTPAQMRVAAAQVVAVDGGAQRQVLALGEGEGLAQRLGHVEGDDRPPRRCRARCGAHAGGGTGVSWMFRRVISGLKCSKGSRQSRQRYSALQAVEPKADSRSVRGLPQRGQARSRACSGRRLHRGGATGPGGDAVGAQLARASALIQSVVQAGARCATRTGPRPARGLDRAHALLDDLGGRAARVGGREHHLQRGRPRLRTSRTMPRSHHREHRHLGVGHAGQHGPGARVATFGRRSGLRSPHAPGVGALQRLHLGQQM